MSDFTVPTSFTIIGGEHDVSGISQMSPRKTIGGGATADGVDESDTWLRNARYAWTQANRANLFESWAYGDASPQAALHTETQASYQEVWEVPVKLVTGRLSFTCTTDLQYGMVKYELFSSGDVSRGSVESNGGADAGSTQDQYDDTLTASSTDVAYLKISVKKETAGNAKVFGVRVHEDASTL